METQSKLKINEFYSVCLYLAKESSKIIQKLNETKQQHKEYKGKDDPFTQADLASQKLLIDGIKYYWPTIKFVAEEEQDPENIWPFDFEKQINKTVLTENFLTLDKQNNQIDNEIDISKIIVYIDPLDGTLAYVRDILDEVQTLIGLSYNNKPLLGMMVQHYKAEKIDENKIQYNYNPQVYFSHALQNKIYTTKLTELQLDQQPTLQEITSESLSKTKNIDQNRLDIVTSAYNPSDKMLNEIKSLNPTKIVHNYGCGKMMLGVILRDVDMYYLNSAGCALIESMGGIAIGMDGQPYEFTEFSNQVVNSRGLLVIWNTQIYTKYKDQIHSFPVSE